MAAKNDITKARIVSKPSTDAYRNSPYWENREKEKARENEVACDDKDNCEECKEGCEKS